MKVNDEQANLQRRLAEAAQAMNDVVGSEAQQSGFPDKVWKLAASADLLGIPFDVEFGGLGHSLPSTVEAFEAFGQALADSGVGFSISTHVVSTGIPLQLFASDYLKRRYLPSICDGSMIGAHAITEPDSGSDASSMQTTAERVGDGYLLSGHKQFISNASIADLIVVYARCGDGGSGTSAFLIPTDSLGLLVESPVDKMGLTRSPMSNVTLDNCYVPAVNLIGEPGSGFFILDRVMKWEILISFSIVVGAMQRRLERCVRRARSRHQFGKAIGSHQSISNKLVDMKIDTETSRRWIRETAERMNAGREVTSDVAITKLLVSESNLRSSLDAVQIFGGAGYLSETGLEAEVRDAVGGTIYSGTSEIQRNRIASMLGLNP